MSVQVVESQYVVLQARSKENRGLCMYMRMLLFLYVCLRTYCTDLQHRKQFSISATTRHSLAMQAIVLW